jgi:hypothetical protein
MIAESLSAIDSAGITAVSRDAVKGLAVAAFNVRTEALSKFQASTHLAGAPEVAPVTVKIFVVELYAQVPVI